MIIMMIVGYCDFIHTLRGTIYMPPELNQRVEKEYSAPPESVEKNPQSLNELNFARQFFIAG